MTTDRKTRPVSDKEWAILTQELIRAYDEKRDKKLTKPLDLNITHVPHFDDLAYLIKEKTRQKVSASILLAFCNRKNPDRNFRVASLNIICHFIVGKKTSLEDFFIKIKAKQNVLKGNYTVYWTGTTDLQTSAKPSTQMDIRFLENSVKLYKTNNKIAYTGPLPEKHQGKLYIELFSHKESEKVYFILHVGGATFNELDVVPGIFSSGDQANITACAGPLLLVKQDLELPQIELIVNNYFEQFSNNNLIKSPLITDVLATVKNIKNPQKTNKINQSTDLEAKLAQYFNKKFFLYFWTRLDNNSNSGLGRITLSIGKDTNNLTLTSKSRIKYSGHFKLINSSFIEFSFRTEITHENSLTLKFKIGVEDVRPYAIGVYSVINESGAIEAGTILMQQYQDQAPFEVSIFSYSDEKPPYLTTNVWNYFKDKHLNRIKVPSSGIHSEEDFTRFFSHNRNKMKIKKTALISKIFIATPMSAHVESFDEIRLKVLELKTWLEEHFNSEVYYAGEDYNKEAGFTHHDTAANLDLKMLDESSHFILIYPTKVATSALLELGWALAQKKSCVVFYKKEEDLPFLLKGIPSSSVKKTEYKDMNHLLAKVKQIGKNLFP